MGTAEMENQASSDIQSGSDDVDTGSNLSRSRRGAKGVSPGTIVQNTKSASGADVPVAKYVEARHASRRNKEAIVASRSTNIEPEAVSTSDH